MHKLFIAILFFTFVSCVEEDHFIYYSYDGVTITRVDKGNEISFYYGNYNSTNILPNANIKASYRGFDGFIDGYLVFKENRTVKIIPMGGLFETVSPRDTFKIEEFNNNIDFIKWEDKFKGNYHNIYRISDIKKIEIERNKQNKSAVKAIYN